MLSMKDGCLTQAGLLCIPSKIEVSRSSLMCFRDWVVSIREPVKRGMRRQLKLLRNWPISQEQMISGFFLLMFPRWDDLMRNPNSQQAS